MEASGSLNFCIFLKNLTMTFHNGYDRKFMTLYKYEFIST